jgi:hypothetical protein
MKLRVSASWWVFKINKNSYRRTALWANPLLCGFSRGNFFRHISYFFKRNDFVFDALRANLRLSAASSFPHPR